MKIEFIEFSRTETGVNREALKQGVEGVTCLFAGPYGDGWDGLHPHVRRLIEENRPKPGMVSSIEVYENNAVNAYIRRIPSEPAYGFLRYREDEDN